MRLLHILGELRPSGAELMYAAAAELWKSRGFQCEILSTGQTTGPMASRLAEAGYRIHHIPFQRSSAHVLAVYHFLRQERFDVIHVNSEQASFWYSASAYLAGTRRLFRTVHSVFPFTGTLRLRRRLQRQLMRALGVHMIAISPSVKATELRHYANPTALVPNWFDDRVYVPPTTEQRAAARAELKIAPATVAFISVAGQCATVKNHSAILRALALLPKSCKIVYLHVGKEDSDLAERKLAAELGISDRVHFLGVTATPLPALYASDVYLMPSMHEGFGCAALEAMGVGLPAILSDVPGLRDFAEVCPEIAWVQPTAQSIACAMQQLMAISADQRRAIGLRLSAAAHQHFGVGHGALAYAALYAGDNGHGGA